MKSTAGRGQARDAGTPSVTIRYVDRCRTGASCQPPRHAAFTAISAPASLPVPGPALSEPGFLAVRAKTGSGADASCYRAYSATINSGRRALPRRARDHRKADEPDLTENHIEVAEPIRKTYGPIAKAIASLLSPHAEVAVHDLHSSKIVYLANAFSKRLVGDDSLVDDDLEDICAVPVYGPYEKANVNGDPLKSVTVVLRDAGENAVGLLCINMNLAVFAKAHRALADLLSFDQAIGGAEPLIARDWRETANFRIQSFLREKSKTLAALSKEERSELVSMLAQHGFFEIRGASERLASQLGMSRATLYRFLAAASSTKR